MPERARPGGRWAELAIAAFLLFQPVSDVLRHRFVLPLVHAGFDSHGDLRHDLLDYLEAVERHEEERFYR